MSQSTELAWLVSVVAVGLGAFVATSPAQAARIWGWEKFDGLSPAEKVLFIRWFRIFEILLWLAGLLIAVDSLWDSNYHHRGVTASQHVDCFGGSGPHRL